MKLTLAFAIFTLITLSACSRAMKVSNASEGTTVGGSIVPPTDSPTTALSVMGTSVAFTLGTTYGPMAADGFLAVYARLDGRAGQATLRVKAGTSAATLVNKGSAYLYNNGVNYPGTSQLLVPIAQGSYVQILCDEAAACSGGGFLGVASLTFYPLQSATSGGANPRLFGVPTSVTLGQVYGPAASDGFVMAYGRLDGRYYSSKLQINTGSTATPTTMMAHAFSYNNGSAYLGNYQLMAVVRKGEYYRVVCDNGSQCSNGAFLGDSLLYFQPIAEGQSTSVFGAPVNLTIGTSTPAPSDGFVFLYGHLDGHFNGYHSLQLKIDGLANVAWGGMLNYYNSGPDNGYLGTWQLKLPIRAGQTIQALCDDGATCSNGGYVGEGLYYFIPTPRL